MTSSSNDRDRKSKGIGIGGIAGGNGGDSGTCENNQRENPM